ncbi:hypothetical protein ACJRO7_021347 [Eucalyptus globulus]|uniref:Uncharacterized protein n=1 Tax=Eucalyptus globulus TaxID=34317 RepID=A0ABD3KP21_EUCGL
MAVLAHTFTGLLLLSLSLAISAEAIVFKERESFSKFTDANERETLKKQEDKEQQPTHHPQTQNGYDLYRHEEEMIKNTPATATSTSTGNHPYKTTMPDYSFYSYPYGNFENSNSYYNDRSYDRRSNNCYNKDAYVTYQRGQARDTYMPEEQNFGGNTRLQDSSYTTTTTTITTTTTSSSSGSSRGTNERNNYYTDGIQIGGPRRPNGGRSRRRNGGRNREEKTHAPERPAEGTCESPL